MQHEPLGLSYYATTSKELASDQPEQAEYGHRENPAAGCRRIIPTFLNPKTKNLIILVTMEITDK